MEEVYLTRQGYDKLLEELNFLKNVRRRELSAEIKKAREFGDISENAEYDAAKESQGMNEKKIVELESKLACARIIDNENIAKDKVLIGALVKVKDLDTGEELEYTLVSSLEADISQNKISTVSPVGKSLLGHKENDEVEIKIPAGILRYKILSISR
ncbi:MAG: transcription elongation factor GreA [Candidatus Omnitrophota bacterium]